MGNPSLKANTDIYKDIRQREHEIGVTEARLMLAGREHELVTSKIRREVAAADDDTRRHGTPTGLGAAVHRL